MAVSFAHLPVLADPVLESFAGLPGQPEGAGEGPGLLLDCTLGGGGHSALLLAAHPQLRLIGLDRDPLPGPRPLSGSPPSAIGP